MEDVLFRSARLPGCRIRGQYPALVGEGRDGRTRGTETAARVPRSPWRTDQESGSGSARGSPEAITVAIGSRFPRRRSGGHGDPVGRRPSTGSLGAPIVIVGALLLAVSYTHLRAHETPEHLVCRLLLEKKKKTKQHKQ